MLAPVSSRLQALRGSSRIISSSRVTLLTNRSSTPARFLSSYHGERLPSSCSDNHKPRSSHRQHHLSSSTCCSPVISPTRTINTWHPYAILSEGGGASATIIAKRHISIYSPLLNKEEEKEAVASAEDDVDGGKEEDGGDEEEKSEKSRSAAAQKKGPVARHLDRDRSKVIPVEQSMRYLKSAAYRETYGGNPVWVLYRRNFPGQWAPKKTRKTCIRNDEITTGNPCPICRDVYLVVDYRNVDLLQQFISPYTGEVLGWDKTGVCRRQQERLLIAIEKAKDYGTITFDVPFREYDWKEYENVYASYNK